VGVKHAIVLIRLIGMSLAANPPCLSIRCLNLLFQRILSIQTMAFILSSLTWWQPPITSLCPLHKPYWHRVVRQKVFHAPLFFLSFNRQELVSNVVGITLLLSKWIIASWMQRGMIFSLGRCAVSLRIVPSFPHTSLTRIASSSIFGSLK
jgi:hypothetical protein